MNKTQKKWTQVNVHNSQNQIVSSFILTTQNIVDVAEVMQEDINQRDGYYWASAVRWEEIPDGNTKKMVWPFYTMDSVGAKTYAKFEKYFIKTNP